MSEWTNIGPDIIKTLRGPLFVGHPLDKRDVKSYCEYYTVNSKSWKPSVKNRCYKWSIFCGHQNLYFLDCRQKTELLMRKLS